LPTGRPAIFVSSPRAQKFSGADKTGRLHLAEALSYRALAEDQRRAA
jgi:hypothetical protein